MSAESLQHRWKHEIQTAPPTTKSSHETGSPPQPISTSGVASRLFHKQSSQSLGPSSAAGGDGDEDAETGTDTAIPDDDDDDDDIASVQSTVHITAALKL